MSFKGYSGSYFILCGMALLAMFSTSHLFPVIPLYAREIGTSGVVIGTYRTFFDLESILGPIVMAAVFEAYGMLPYLYLASALLLANLVPAMRLGENRV